MILYLSFDKKNDVFLYIVDVNKDFLYIKTYQYFIIVGSEATLKLQLSVHLLATFKRET